MKVSYFENAKSKTPIMANLEDLFEEIKNGIYKKQVEELEAKHVLTEQEEVEEHRLKKLKLHLKDVMEQMIHEHASQQVAWSSDALRVLDHAQFSLAPGPEFPVSGARYFKVTVD